MTRKNLKPPKMRNFLPFKKASDVFVLSCKLAPGFLCVLNNNLIITGIETIILHPKNS